MEGDIRLRLFMDGLIGEGFVKSNYFTIAARGRGILSVENQQRGLFDPEDDRRLLRAGGVETQIIRGDRCADQVEIMNCLVENGQAGEIAQGR
jgi:hypothetical protein